MNMERKLVDALERNDLIKIEKLFNDIYNSNYKLVYFCVANFVVTTCLDYSNYNNVEYNRLTL